MTDGDIAWFDVESTGLDPQLDRVTEVAIHRGGITSSWLVNPGRPIGPDVEKLTGITNADVADRPGFRAVAADVARQLNAPVLAGFGLTLLDVPLLAAEFERAGVAFDWTNKTLLDVGELFKILHPRRLADAVRLYCGRDHAGAHRAAADALATAEVFGGMLAAPELAGKPLAEVALLSTRGRRLADPAGKVHFDAAGRLCYSFGQHRDTPVADRPDYADWMLSRDFPLSTRRAIEAELARLRGADPDDDSDLWGTDLEDALP